VFGKSKKMIDKISYDNDDGFLKSYSTVDDVIDHLKNNIKTEVGVSPIHGVGVFSIRDIKKGEQVFPNWEGETGIYIIPNERLKEIPKEVLYLLDKYFINEECGYKIIRLFKGFNFLSHSFSFCNSAYKTNYTQNIDSKGIALVDIKEGEEILEWYVENIYLDNSK
jgi:hypothetical protein